jgi:CRISPR type III-A-associated protein Csm2
VGSLNKEDFEELKKKLKSIKYLKDLDEETIIKGMDSLAKKVSVTPTQIRKVYGELRRLKGKQDFKRKLIRLEPRLAYAVAREKGLELLYDIFRESREKIIDENDLEKLIFMFETLVAYQKYHEAFQQGR